MPLDLLITTGPTGGHFFPGLATGEELACPGSQIRVGFVVPDRGYIRHWLQKKGFPAWFFPDFRASMRRALPLCVRIPDILRRCNAILASCRPSAVFATGSYASVPLSLAARAAGVRLVLHEQNVTAGRATRMLSLCATATAVTFPDTRGLRTAKTWHTGLPIPRDFRRGADRFEALRRFGLSSGLKTLLIMGGSQGSSFLNRMAQQHAAFFRKDGWQLLHLAGSDAERVRAAYRDAGTPAAVLPFCYEMGAAYAAADAAVCRAGAGTLAELCEHALPAIVVPYPFAGRHQAENAAYVAALGGCAVLPQEVSAARRFPELLADVYRRSDEMRRCLQRARIVDREGNVASLLRRILLQ